MYSFSTSCTRDTLPIGCNIYTYNKIFTDRSVSVHVRQIAKTVTEDVYKFKKTQKNGFLQLLYVFLRLSQISLA